MVRLTALVALLGALVTSNASAQEPAGGGEVKTKFYSFDDMLVDGAYKKPQVLFTDGRQKVKFDRLMKLQRDFLPQLRATSKDASLR